MFPDWPKVSKCLHGMYLDPQKYSHGNPLRGSKHIPIGYLGLLADCPLRHRSRCSSSCSTPWAGSSGSLNTYKYDGSSVASLWCSVPRVDFKMILVTIEASIVARA